MADTDLNKIRADLVKQVNYLFANPSLPKATKEKAVSALKELVKLLGGAS